MKHKQLQLITLLEGDKQFELIEMLAQLGYSDIQIINPARHAGELHQEQNNNMAFVMMMDGSADDIQLLESFIQKYRPFPLLGLFTCNFAQLHTHEYSQFTDFVKWPCSMAELSVRLNRMDSFYAEKKNDLPSDVVTDFMAMNLVGASPAFMEVLSTIKQIAPYDVSVAIYGETGTGKELVARAVHYLGSRSEGPFIPVNCGALPDSLLENELFGHERGAFTDASRDQVGLIAQAENGTIFLDEIEALTPKAQATLLRFLQDKQYRPLGGKKLYSANVRIISASNVELEKMVELGKFRADLYYRLNVLPITLPALREREGDIELLADFFMQQFQSCYATRPKHLHKITRLVMEEYEWPGNIRELENRLHRAFLMTSGNMILPGHLQFDANDVMGSSQETPHTQLHYLPFNDAKSNILANFEREYLTGLMKRCNGNVTLAAKHANKERRSLGKLLKKHNIQYQNNL